MFLPLKAPCPTPFPLPSSGGNLRQCQQRRLFKDARNRNSLPRAVRTAASLFPLEVRDDRPGRRPRNGRQGNAVAAPASPWRRSNMARRSLLFFPRRLLRETQHVAAAPCNTLSLGMPSVLGILAVFPSIPFPGSRFLLSSLRPGPCFLFASVLFFLPQLTHFVIPCSVFSAWACTFCSLCLARSSAISFFVLLISTCSAV